MNPSYEGAQCAKSAGIQTQGRLDSLDDRLLKLSAMINSAIDTIACNADRTLGCMPPTPATLGSHNSPLRGEAVQDTAIGRLFDRVSALTTIAEALNTQAHRFDSL